MAINKYRIIVTWLLFVAVLANTFGAPSKPAFALPESIESDRDAYFLTRVNGTEPATDSASAGTAIATGWKTDDGNVAWKPGDPAGGNLTTIAQYVHDAPFNFSIGVASTVPFSHATPATFVSHNVSRSNYSAIAQEIINTTTPEVVIGGGHPFYSSTPANYNYVGGQTLWNDLMTGATPYTHYVARTIGVNGGTALRNKANSMDLTTHPDQKLIGVFGGPGGNFEFHNVADAPGAPAVTLGSTENPSLADVTTSTLKVLSQDPQGFFVMFEQGDIDWANHENNFKNMVGGVWDLEQAVKTAEAYINQAGGPEWTDTLMIVTSDHSNSYMRLPYPLGKGDLPTQEWVDLNNNSKVDNGEWYYPNGEVTYRTNNHTNELVTLFARGAHAEDFNTLAGSWYPGTTILDNSQIYQVMKGAVDGGVKHVILFIGDGMNIEHEIAASRYLYGSDFALTWDNWQPTYGGVMLPVATWDVTTYNKYGSIQLPVVTWNTAGTGEINLGANIATIGYDPAKGGALPYPLDWYAELKKTKDTGNYFLTLISGKEPATDSASAATAIATGWKTVDGNVAWKPYDPTGGSLTTIAERLRSGKGYAIGVASTVQFSHATPATFVSHNIDRSNYAAIANEIISGAMPEVVIGGGHPFFFAAVPEYKYVGGSTTWSNLTTPGQTVYTDFVQRQAGIDGGASLVAAANDVNLGGGEKFMGVFGGPGGNFEYHQVADAPGSPAITRGSIENPTLSDVTTSTLKVLSQDPQGFFVMFEQGDIDWSNHANDFKGMIGGVWDLDQAVRTAQDYVALPGGPEWADTLIIVTSDHSNSYLRLNKWLGKGDLPTQVWTDDGDGMVEYGESTYPDGEVSYSSGQHTNEAVTLWARGKGAELFQQYINNWYAKTQMLDNSQIYEVMRRAAEEQGARHIILFIGDGMHVEHEIAGSRYLYGVDMGLAWHSWGALADGFAGFVNTWDVTTYNKYAGNPTAWVTPAAPLSLGGNTPALGYDVVKGGSSPYPLQPGYADMSATPYLYFELEPGQLLSKTITLSKTGNINLAWSQAEATAADWLNASPNAGYLIYDGAATITANVNTAGMQPGHYRSDLKITTPYRDFTVPVVLKVKTAGTAPVATNPFTMQFLGSYRTGKSTAAEIAAYDPDSYSLYVTNVYSLTLDTLSLANLTTVPTPTLTTRMDIKPYGDDITSVDVKNGLVAVSLPSVPKTDPGVVLFLQNSQAVTVTVGALPDMVTFSPDGKLLLVANEGEPSPDYTIDPNGSISIIDVSGGIGSITQAKVATLDFSSFTNLDPKIRIYGQNPSIAKDLEPEYITVAPDSSKAWVTLQENNAIAMIDLQTKTITDVRPLGFKDWSAVFGLDASDQTPKTINITNFPIWGMYQPDGVASYTVDGTTYLVTANEGDSRDYTELGGTFNEEMRIKDASLDPAVFPNAAELKATNMLGRLKITRFGTAGSAFAPDLEGDGDVDALYAFGARSFSIWNGTTGELVWDSGDQIERITATQTPTYFNANDGSAAKWDERSDDKGAEPESVILANLDGRTFAFIALERSQGGVMVYDVTNPATPVFALYMPNPIGDISPEGLRFIPAWQSPTHKPLLVLANELTGSTAVFQINLPKTDYYLPLVYR